MVDGYFTPAELCHRWKNTITEKTLANWRCAGDGPAYTKIGGRVMYAVEDVTAYEKRRRQAKSERTGAEAR